VRSDLPSDIPWVAEVLVRGTVGSYRVDVHLSLAFHGGAVRIETMPGSDGASFVFVSNGSEMTLLLPDENRVLKKGTDCWCLDTCSECL
jgi:hypothetical protein